MMQEWVKTYIGHILIKNDIISLLKWFISFLFLGKDVAFMDNSEYMTTQDIKKLTGLNSAILFKLRKSEKLPYQSNYLRMATKWK